MVTRRHLRLAMVVASVLAALCAVAVVPSMASASNGHSDKGSLQQFKHLVVIYEENHSFDNLYGRWGPVNGQAINGLGQADLDHTVQVAENGTPYSCLNQNDVNLTSPPLSVVCTDPNPAVGSSHFVNLPFKIDDYIPPSATTCPAPGVFAAHGVPNGSGQPGGCTEDIVHRFYQEQYQLDGGRQNRYTTGSDAVGLTMGHYRTPALPIY